MENTMTSINILELPSVPETFALKAGDEAACIESNTFACVGGHTPVILSNGQNLGGKKIAFTATPQSSKPMPDYTVVVGIGGLTDRSLKDFKAEMVRVVKASATKRDGKAIPANPGIPVYLGGACKVGKEPYVNYAKGHHYFCAFVPASLTNRNPFVDIRGLAEEKAAPRRQDDVRDWFDF